MVKRNEVEHVESARNAGHDRDSRPLRDAHGRKLTQHKLSVREIRDLWPLSQPAPKELTLWRWLKRAVDQGNVLQSGSGFRNDPHRYWLLGQEENWANDPTRLPVDALHVAVAAVNGVEYLLTWNCKHIANPSLRPRIEQRCRELVYEPPAICTPQELLEIDDAI